MVAIPTQTQIPGAGIYLEHQAQAEQAYAQAMAELGARKKGLFNEFGLLESGQVDPNSRFGRYQMQLQQQGAELDSAEDEAAGRGLRGAGLGQQAGSMMRFQHGAQNLAFQRSLANSLADLRSAELGAARTRSEGLLSAKRAALEGAIDAGDFMPVAMAPEPAAPVVARPEVAAAAQAKPKGKVKTKYYTYKKNVPKGQKVKFKPGKGYYAGGRK